MALLNGISNTLNLLLNPALYLHIRSSYLQRYLLSTSVAPVLDIASAILSSITLLWQGLPITAVLSQVPHFLSGRNRPVNDSLARIRLSFSVIWTTTLAFRSAVLSDEDGVVSANFRSSADVAYFWINALATIVLLAPRFKNGARDLDGILESHHISPATIHHWITNLSIWIHTLIILSPFLDLSLLTLNLTNSPILAPENKDPTYYITAPLIVTLCFLSNSLLAIFLYQIFDFLSSPHTHSGPRRGAVAAFVIGGITSICYAGCLRLLGAEQVTFVTWAVSDALLWGSWEAFVAWSDMMSRDEFGEYMRREGARKRRERELAGEMGDEGKDGVDKDDDVVQDRGKEKDMEKDQGMI